MAASLLAATVDTPNIRARKRDKMLSAAFPLRILNPPRVSQIEALYPNAHLRDLVLACLCLENEACSHVTFGFYCRH
jgi:hypothetical protein